MAWSSAEPTRGCFRSAARTRRQLARSRIRNLPLPATPRTSFRRRPGVKVDDSEPSATANRSRHSTCGLSLGIEGFFGGELWYPLTTSARETVNETTRSGFYLDRTHRGDRDPRDSGSHGNSEIHRRIEGGRECGLAGRRRRHLIRDRDELRRETHQLGKW